jgi:hypothetical protein
MHRYYVLEIIFILLGIALTVTAVRYPKDVLVKLPLELIKLPFRIIWEKALALFTLLILPVTLLAEKFNWRIFQRSKRD